MPATEWSMAIGFLRIIFFIVIFVCMLVVIVARLSFGVRTDSHFVRTEPVALRDGQGCTVEQ
jgi:hypothetical protein